MKHWTTLLALSAALLLAGCLWGPGKFASDLTLRKDNSFVLNYRGEIVIQMPDDSDRAKGSSPDQAKCYVGDAQSSGKERPCRPAEVASQKADFDKAAA